MGSLSVCDSVCGPGISSKVIGALSPLFGGVTVHETTSIAPTPVMTLQLAGNAGVVPTLATL